MPRSVNRTSAPTSSTAPLHDPVDSQRPVQNDTQTQGPSTTGQSDDATTPFPQLELTIELEHCHRPLHKTVLGPTLSEHTRITLAKYRCAVHPSTGVDHSSMSIASAASAAHPPRNLVTDLEAGTTQIGLQVSFTNLALPGADQNTADHEGTAQETAADEATETLLKLWRDQPLRSKNWGPEVAERLRQKQTEGHPPTLTGSGPGSLVDLISDVLKEGWLEHFNARAESLGQETPFKLFNDSKST